MRRNSWMVLFLVSFVLLDFSAWGDSPLDVIEKELNEAKQQHQEANSQAFLNFLTQLDAVVESSTPDPAFELYKNAGGDVPDPAGVISKHETETSSEQADRTAQDQANLANLANIVWIHCGLMRYAALFIEAPDKKGLNEQWITWLKWAAQLYPQINTSSEDSRVKPSPEGGGNTDASAVAVAKPKKKHPLSKAAIFKLVAVRDSIITTFLGFNSWDDKEQGQWRVADVPKLYQINVLVPLQAKPSAATLAAWDVYIAMKSVDQPDRDKWAQVEYPALLFDRSCDDYKMLPTEQKLEALVHLIQSNPTYPDLEKWIDTVHQMVQDYRVQKDGGVPASSTNSTIPHAPDTSMAPVPDAPNTPVPTLLPENPSSTNSAPATTTTNSAPVPDNSSTTNNAPAPKPASPGLAPLPTTN